MRKLSHYTYARPAQTASALWAKAMMTSPPERMPSTPVRQSCLPSASCLRRSPPTRPISVTVMSCWPPPRVSGWAM